MTNTEPNGDLPIEPLLDDEPSPVDFRNYMFQKLGWAFLIAVILWAFWDAYWVPFRYVIALVILFNLFVAVLNLINWKGWLR